MHISRKARFAVGGLLAVIVAAGSAHCLLAGDPLARRIAPFIGALHGADDRTLHLSVTVPIDGRPQTIDAWLRVIDDQSFRLRVRHPDYEAVLARDAERTTLPLPHHAVRFVGAGPVDAADHLAPAGLLGRVISRHSQAHAYWLMLRHANAGLVAALLQQFAGFAHVEPSPQTAPAGDATDPAAAPGSDRWRSGLPGAPELVFDSQDDAATLRAEAYRGTLTLSRTDDQGRSAHGEPFDAASHADGSMRSIDVDRGELERTIARALHRLTELLAPGGTLTDPSTAARRVEHGYLHWIDGQRVVHLRGTPEQIGRAHGQLLAEQSRQCLDSSLHLVGLVHSVREGRWFGHVIRDAWRRLEPHIPPEQLTEMNALADGAGLPREQVRLANVFPELFHCSGFAVFGSATVDGVLYHGRVLDYMTRIGLQHAATVFVVEPAAPDRRAFVSVGYAGFIGSVSGMNDAGLALGEMGGGGVGQWDGAPMASLMRLALETCSDTDQTVELWRPRPRTCEYFYVFSDPRSAAVAVGATPERLDVLHPGESHPRLGGGVADAVLLSAGDRLKTLRDRVEQHHGRIDLSRALWLMSRPVAMSSNLHNVLFVPQRLGLHVAQADDHRPAAERPYTRLRLDELLDAAWPGR